MTPRPVRPVAAEARGISLIETVIASLLISLVLSSTLALVAPVVRGSTNATDHLRAARLAAELLDEARTRAFDDPDGEDGNIGTEAGEDPSDRPAFDDVDDYDGWASSPPQTSEGVVRADLTGWIRVVRVTHAARSGLAESPSRTGLKRVRVVVSRDGTTLAALEAFVSGPLTAGPGGG